MNSCTILKIYRILITKSSCKFDFIVLRLGIQKVIEFFLSGTIKILNFVYGCLILKLSNVTVGKNLSYSKLASIFTVLADILIENKLINSKRIFCVFSLIKRTFLRDYMIH